MTEIPPLSQTTPETFILESLSLEDERQGRMDGKILYDTLKLHGKNPVYYYFRTQTELIKLSEEFRASGYRYLHLSCHGNDEQILYTFGATEFNGFAEIFSGKLGNRRIFFSGCNLGRRDLAEALFAKNGGMYSLTAPTRTVFFDQTVAFWSAFYYLMHSHSSKFMKKAQIGEALTKLSNLFEMPIAHYFRNTAKNGVVDECVFDGSMQSLRDLGLPKKGRDSSSLPV